MGPLGRCEIVRSLGPGTLQQARYLANQLDERVERIFAAVRAAGGDDAVDVEELIGRLCDDYLRELMGADHAERRQSPTSDEQREMERDALADALERESELLDRCKVDHVRDDAMRLLAGQQLTAEELDALMWELVRTRLVALRQMRDEREGDQVGIPRVPSSRIVAPSREPTDAPWPLLSAAIAAYAEDHEGTRWSPRGADMTKKSLAELLDLIGDKPVREFTKADARSYKVALDKMPSRAGNHYAGLTIGVVLATNPKPGLRVETIRKRLGYALSLFNYCKKMEWVDRNPFDDLRPRKMKGVHTLRDPFTDADLRAIFGQDYTSEALGAARYWIPLVLLYTGARLEEVAQAETADIVEVEGIHCLRITERSSADNDGDAKRLKTAGSDRTVPLHSGLLALGFLRYVEERREAGDRRLFPQLLKIDRRFGSNISKWHGQWRKRHGITSAKKVLHSTRHTFITRLKYADVQEHTISELVGHENDSITTGRYGKKLPIGKLREAVEKLDLGGGLASLRR